MNNQIQSELNDAFRLIADQVMSIRELGDSAGIDTNEEREFWMTAEADFVASSMRILKTHEDEYTKQELVGISLLVGRRIRALVNILRSGEYRSTQAAG